MSMVKDLILGVVSGVISSGIILAIDRQRQFESEKNALVSNMFSIITAGEGIIKNGKEEINIYRFMLDNRYRPGLFQYNTIRQDDEKAAYTGYRMQIEKIIKIINEENEFSKRNTLLKKELEDLEEAVMKLSSAKYKYEFSFSRFKEIIVLKSKRINKEKQYLSEIELHLEMCIDKYWTILNEEGQRDVVNQLKELLKQKDDRALTMKTKVLLLKNSFAEKIICKELERLKRTKVGVINQINANNILCISSDKANTVSALLITTIALLIQVGLYNLEIESAKIGGTVYTLLAAGVGLTMLCNTSKQKKRDFLYNKIKGINMIFESYVVAIDCKIGSLENGAENNLIEFTRAYESQLQ